MTDDHEGCSSREVRDMGVICAICGVALLLTLGALYGAIVAVRGLS